MACWRKGDMTGDWNVQLEDGAHSIHAEANYMTNHLLITWDGSLLESSTVGWMAGDIRTFKKNGHVFLLSVKGLWYMGRLLLSMDGTLLGQGGTPAPLPQQAPMANLQFVEERNVRETEEIVMVDDFPLDNSHGSDPVTSDRQVSRESTNELTVHDSNQISGSLGVDLFQALKVEIAAQISRQTGSKVG